MVKRFTIKLLPPYRPAGDSGEYTLELAAPAEITLEQLAAYLQEEWAERLAYALVDGSGNLTAEFMVNGKPASNSREAADGDTITIFPYIAGG